MGHPLKTVIEFIKPLELRQFGGRCFDTQNVATLPELCTIMAAELEELLDGRYYFSVHPNMHVSLTVAGAVKERANSDELNSMYVLFEKFVEQFNWHCSVDASLHRFKFCQLNLLTPCIEARVEPTLQPVMVSDRSDHVCNAPAYRYR